MEKSKPFSVAIRDTKNDLVSVLNNSGLPLDAMLYILKELVSSVTAQAEQEYRDELAKMQAEKEQSTTD